MPFMASEIKTQFQQKVDIKRKQFRRISKLLTTTMTHNMCAHACMHTIEPNKNNQKTVPVFPTYGST